MTSLMVAWLQVMIDKPMIPRKLRQVRSGENAFMCPVSLQLSGSHSIPVGMTELPEGPATQKRQGAAKSGGLLYSEPVFFSPSYTVILVSGKGGKATAQRPADLCPSC